MSRIHHTAIDVAGVARVMGAGDGGGGRPEVGRGLSRVLLQRKSPLYDACQLEAPDGTVLSYISCTRGDWYIEKNLGDAVERVDGGRAVRLRFEPSRRPDPLDRVDAFNLSGRTNHCVACGDAGDSLTRTYIVPHEYRRFFPDGLASHSSHDVVLMCFGCHERWDASVQIRRRTVAEETDAPLEGVREGPLPVWPYQDAVKAARALSS